MSNPDSEIKQEDEPLELETSQEEERRDSPVRSHFEYRLGVVISSLNNLRKNLAEKEAKTGDDRDEKEIQKLQEKIEKDAQEIERYQDIIISVENGETDKAEDELERESKLVEQKYLPYYTDILSKLRAGSEETIAGSSDESVVASKTESPAEVDDEEFLLTPLPEYNTEQSTPTSVEVPVEASNPADGEEYAREEARKEAETAQERIDGETKEAVKKQYMQEHLAGKEREVMYELWASVWREKISDDKKKILEKEYKVTDVTSFIQHVTEDFVNFTGDKYVVTKKDGSQEYDQEAIMKTMCGLLDAGLDPYEMRTPFFKWKKVVVKKLDGSEPLEVSSGEGFESWLDDVKDAYDKKVKDQAEQRLGKEYEEKREDTINKRSQSFLNSGNNPLEAPPPQEEKKAVPSPLSPEKSIVKKEKFKKGVLPENIKKQIIAKIEQDILLYPTDSETPNKKELEEREKGLIIAFKKKKLGESDTDLIRETFNYFLEETANVRKWAEGKDKTSKEYKNWKKMSGITRELADQIAGKDITKAAIEKFDNLTPEEIENFKKDQNYNEKDFRNRYIKTFEDNVIKKLQMTIASERVAAVMGATPDDGTRQSPAEEPEVSFEDIEELVEKAEAMRPQGENLEPVVPAEPTAPAEKPAEPEPAAELPVEVIKEPETVEQKYKKLLKDVKGGYPGANLKEFQFYGRIRTRADELKKEKKLKWDEAIEGAVAELEVDENGNFKYPDIWAKKPKK